MCKPQHDSEKSNNEKSNKPTQAVSPKWIVEDTLNNCNSESATNEGQFKCQTGYQNGKLVDSPRKRSIPAEESAITLAFSNDCESAERFGPNRECRSRHGITDEE